MTIDQLAQRMYAERVAERGPRWDQLGDVTRGVWLERAAVELFG
jgi:hypothetical protein